MTQKPTSVFDIVSNTSNLPNVSTSISNASKLPTRIPFSQKDVETKVKQSTDTRRFRYTADPEFPNYLFAALNPTVVGRGAASEVGYDDELYKFVKYYVDLQGALTDKWKARSESSEKQLAACKAALDVANKRIAELTAELDACRNENARLAEELERCRNSTQPLGEFAKTDDSELEASKKSSNAIWWILGGTAVVGSGYYIYQKKKNK
jgi:hypothetical protein